MKTPGVQEISENDFFSNKQNSYFGIGCDDPATVLKLELANVRMLKRELKTMVYAVEFEPSKFDPALLDLLPHLLNIEQIQLQNCNVVDEDLVKLRKLPKLTAIGLNNTPVTTAGLRQLQGFQRLELIQFNGKTYESVSEILNSDQ